MVVTTTSSSARNDGSGHGDPCRWRQDSMTPARLFPTMTTDLLNLSNTGHSFGDGVYDLLWLGTTLDGGDVDLR